MKVKVVSADPQDIRVISDLMRIYFPDLSSNEENSELITNKILPQEEVILKVKKNGIPQELDTILKIKRKIPAKGRSTKRDLCEERPIGKTVITLSYT